MLINLNQYTDKEKNKKEYKNIKSQIATLVMEFTVLMSRNQKKIIIKK